MRIGKAAVVAAAVLAAGWIFQATGVLAGRGPMIRLVDMEDGGDGGTAINLTVSRVTIQPVRAHVGDVVHVEIWVDNREDGSQVSNAQIFANGKVVANRLFRWGMPGDDHNYKLKFDLDTRGWAPGQYKIKGEVDVREDISPFDNELTAKQPLILAPPGGGFPGGEEAGGSYSEIDPRYK